MQKDRILSIITGILIVVAIIGLMVQIKEPKPALRTVHIVAGSDTVTVAGYLVLTSLTLPAEQHSDSLTVITIPEPHNCTWEDCEQKGNKVFKPSGRYEEGTDGYLWEKAHYDHPAWTNEQCEDYVFIPLNT